MDILIAPKECKKLVQVQLPRPKNGQPQHFFHDEDNVALFEIVKYSDNFRSWFIDNIFCRDGHYNILTKIDPLYIFVPQLMKYTKDQYRPLHDILQEFSSTSSDDNMSRLDYALSPEIAWDNVCETKEIDGELFVRFSENKTLDWLAKKHARTMEALKGEMSNQASKATLISYAIDLIDEYVPSELSNKFKDMVKNRFWGTNR